MENLAANSVAASIDSIHREIQSQKAVKIASILNSKPLPVETPKKVLRQYGIPLHDLRIGSLMQDLNALNNDLPDKLDIFSVASWSNRR